MCVVCPCPLCLFTTTVLNIATQHIKLCVALLKTKDTRTNMNAYMNLNLVKVILMDQNHMSEFFFQCKRNASFPRAAWSNLTDE